MNRVPRNRRVLSSLAATLLLLPQLAAQSPSYPTMSRDQEMRLAISAGPLTVSQDADVYVMGRNGFERAITGNNGWSCLVVREAGNPTLLAPQCYNPPATRTVLPAMLLEGTLQARGMEADAIRAELTRQFGSGELPMPEGPAYAYMLSAGQHFGPEIGNFKPHFMLYVPYATNASIGGDPKRPQFPFVGPFPGTPLSTVVIIMDEFVDPSDVVLPGR